MKGKSSDVSEFIARQTEYLRARLSASIDETASLERYSIAITGGLWAWIKAQKLPSELLLWLPVLLTTFLGLRAIVVYGRIRSIRRFLLRVEEAASVPKELRWFATEELAGSRWRPATAFAWWIGLTVVNVALGLVATKLGH